MGWERVVGLVMAGVGEVTLNELERDWWAEEEEGERVGDRSTGVGAGLVLEGALATTAGVDWTKVFSLDTKLVASFRVPTSSAPVEACPAPDPW